MSGSVTVGSVIDPVNTGGMALIYVDGQEVLMPNTLGTWLSQDRSVTVMRLGNGRYQMLAQSGYLAPPKP